MKSFYGPFFQGEEGMWHWRKECPGFPAHANPKMMVSSSYPEKVELCDQCSKIDETDAVSNMKVPDIK